MGPLLAILDFFINACGLNLKSVAGLEKECFGSAILTNVGSFGYDNILAPFPCTLIKSFCGCSIANDFGRS
jgi:hypothetical protein